MGRYDNEQRLDFYKKIAGGLGIAALLVALVLLLGQEYFRWLLEPLGLYVDKRGVFTDCTKPENYNHPYCSKKTSPSDKQWRATKEKPGFNLSDE